VGGSLVPLLTLGIPGSASTAVLIGALSIHDLVAGPQMFRDRPDIIYGLFASLLIANVVLLVLGLFGSRFWIKITIVPKRVLYPMILTISVVGSFAVRNSMFDVAACLGFGVFGWFLRRHQYPVVPIVLGMVLGNIAETNFRQAVMMGGYGVFFTRPVCLGILMVSLIFLAVPIWQSRKQRGA
jgi:putative tricarboxylic transport membrane protein